MELFRKSYSMILFIYLFFYLVHCTITISTTKSNSLDFMISVEKMNISCELSDQILLKQIEDLNNAYNEQTNKKYDRLVIKLKEGY